MSLWDKVKGELVDVIEWTDSTSDTIVHRFERRGNEIKNGARLTVREGQAAVFIDEGELADVFEPGMYTLETANLPVLSTLRGWKHGFQSPFKAEVYFVSTRQFTDQKWGTKNPVMLRDPEFGPVRLRAFGTYAVRVKDAGAFIKEIVGTEDTFTSDEISGQIRNILIARFTDALGESGIPVLDMAAHQDELGKALAGRVQQDLDGYGLELRTLLVENISLPPAVEEALDKRTSMGVVGDLRAFTQYQAAEALGDAARNPGGGGLAAGGLAAGLGMAMGNQVAQGIAQPAAGAAPPPLPPAPEYYAGIDGKQAGPFREAALRDEIRAGRVTRETLVWTQGMAEWKPAGDVEGVARLLGAVPPPLPPA
jgi:membrane protease subunit (stomatin/prohibitin family)